MTNNVGAVQLGHRISQLREQAGIKQADLARRVTFSQAVVSRIESGERELTDEELDAVLDAIGTEDAARLHEILHRRWSILPMPELDHPDQDLLWEAECLGQELTALADDSDVRPAFGRRLSEYVMEIERLGRQLQQRSHRLAFIGPLGIGKSTAICRVTGLEVDGPDGDPLPVLETGGGGVTLCEVHVTAGPGVGILVEPRTYDEIRADVCDFVDHLLGDQEQTGDAAIEEVFRSVPAETERAIRNMAGLQLKRSRQSDGSVQRIDRARELAERISNRRELIVEILARMDLPRRDRRDAWFDAASGPSPLEWLKATFEQINNGRHPEFSLPARIELVVPSVLGFPQLDISIVDTRGIDQLTARADLETHLEDPHTVSLLCSGFNDAPEQSVHHLLKRAREIGNPQVARNACVLILPHKGEALAVKDESGARATTVEEGYDLKSEQVATALSAYRLETLPQIFFDAFGDDRVRLRDSLELQVSQVRDAFRADLADVLTQGRALMQNRAQAEVLAVQEEVAKDLESWMQIHSSSRPLNGHLYENLLAEMRQAHASSVRASVRREGSWYALDYTHQLGFGARRLAVSALGEYARAFTDTCEVLAGSHPEAAELLSQASRLMTQSYNELLRKMQLTGSTIYDDALGSADDLWTESDAEWGRGQGYRDRVSQHHLGWFSDERRVALEGQFKDVLAREWSEVLDRIRSILG